MNLPEEDEERWFDWVERMFSNALLDKDDQREAVRDAEAYIDALIAERKRSRATTSSGCCSRPRSTATACPTLEVRQFGILMLLAGYETTSGAMGMSLLHLAEHPEQRAQLFGDPDGLAHTAVNELLRFVSPVQVFGRNARARRRAPRRDDPRRRRRPARLRRGEPRPARLRASPSGASSTATRTATSRSATAATSAWARTSPGSSSRS